MALETREVDRLRNLENCFQDTILKMQNLQKEESTATAGDQSATVCHISSPSICQPFVLCVIVLKMNNRAQQQTLQSGSAMAEGADTEEEDVIVSSLTEGVWRRQIQVSEERAAQRLQDLQKVNNDIIDQLRLLSADNEVKSDNPPPFPPETCIMTGQPSNVCNLSKVCTVLADCYFAAVVPV